MSSVIQTCQGYIRYVMDGILSSHTLSNLTQDGHLELECLAE